MFLVYLVLSMVGLVGTWYFNLRYDGAEGGYLQAWFANAASSSAAVDIIIVAVAAVLFMIIEGRELRMRATWPLVLLTFPVAAAFTIPLFLALRHRRLNHIPSPLESAP